MKLLQTRNWIDSPLTYRNGRRALLTMEKGTTGMEAFAQAIRRPDDKDRNIHIEPVDAEA